MPTQGYFDYNATTPVCQAAIDAFSEAIAEFGNPSSKYGLAKSPKERLDEARNRIAQLIMADPDEITFTSGGTEANNWAMKGALYACGAMTPGADNKPAHIVISEIEHSSVLEVASFLERVFGFEVTRLRPNSEGLIQVESVRAALRPNTRLVSIMLVNNEVGTMQPIREIARLLHERNLHFHVDGVQAVGKIEVDVHDLDVDTLAFAGHKFYGPKGVGGLYIKRGVKVEALLHGGGQERGLRGGTEAVASIVAMGAAAAWTGSGLHELQIKLAGFKHHMRDLLRERIPDIHFHGPEDESLQAPNTLSVCVPGIRAEALAALLDNMFGMQVSLGSACSNNKEISLSHVLVAMGLDEETIKSTMRVSFGHYTHENDLLRFADALGKGVNTLRRISKNVRENNGLAA